MTPGPPKAAKALVLGKRRKALRKRVSMSKSDKYEKTAREIRNDQIGAFFSKSKMTFRKVTPTASKVNVKKI